jgi:protein-disulfide isomerase
VITRRDFVAGTSTLALVAALQPSIASVAFAQNAKVSEVELLEAGPIEEMSVGKADAPVTVVEYASMTCGHCAAFHTSTYPEFKKRYVDTGKARYILREFPLDPLAAGAFMLARCAGKDKYFPMVETLFQQQRNWAVQKPLEPLFAIARQAGFTQQSFDECLRDQKMLDGIEKVRARGADRFKVESTPTFFINGTMYRGAMTIDQMEKVIDPLLKS